jgi:hypothetical protein
MLVQVAPFTSVKGDGIEIDGRLWLCAELGVLFGSMA